MTATEIAEALGMALSTVSLWPEADRTGQTLAAWTRPSHPTVMSAVILGSSSTLGMERKAAVADRRVVNAGSVSCASTC